MKRYAFLAFLLSSLNLVVDAQVTFKPSIFIGPNLSIISRDISAIHGAYHMPNTDFKFTCGAELEILFKNKFGLLTGFRYQSSQSSARIDQTSIKELNGSWMEWGTKTSNFLFPINFIYQQNFKKTQANIQFQTGVSIGFEQAEAYGIGWYLMDANNVNGNIVGYDQGWWGDDFKLHPQFGIDAAVKFQPFQRDYGLSASFGFHYDFLHLSEERPEGKFENVTLNETDSYQSVYKPKMAYIWFAVHYGIKFKPKHKQAMTEQMKF